MKKELLFSVTKKDLKVDWFSGKGAGGQYRNKHQNCCRIRHKDSGAIATAQEERSRKANLAKALKRLTETTKYKLWTNRRIYEISKQAKIDKVEIERQVEEAMKPENLKIECYEAGE